MKKLHFIILFLYSSFLLSQSWTQDNNAFNNPNRGAYEDLSRKKEQEINRDMGNIKKIINRTGSIANHLQENETTQNAGPGSPGEPIPNGGPGSPGEPAPIDKYKGLLFLLGFILIIFSKKRLKPSDKISIAKKHSHSANDIS